MVRVARIASTALVTAGLVILLDAGLTLVWQEPISSYLAQGAQNEAEEELDALRSDFAGEISAEGLKPGELDEQVRELATRFLPRLETGEPIGQIRIPSIGVDFTIVEGTDTETLTKGPGHYPETKIPGLGGTTGIAGHRTTYLAPFHDIDKLKKGDAIIVEMPYANFRYEVEKSEIVTPDRVDVVDDIGRERLVLSACHPLYSAAERYIIFARLDEVGLFGPIERRWQDP